MGHGISRRKKETNLYLPNCELTFSSSQLTFLNYHLSDQLTNISADLRCDPHHDSSIALVERLMQRLLCGVGTLDPRFSSKFLINLDPTRPSSRNLNYLVRLDNLSTPLLYPQDSEQLTCSVLQAEGGPQGFAKIRPSGSQLQDWAEFINNNGFLRRDKVQERFVELLATAASRSSLPEPPDRIDESRLCGAAGKVVDPEVAFYLASSPPQNQFYFGTAECHRHSFPDPREFRLAIVEGTPCVRLRVGLLPPHCYSTSEEDVQVTLTLGIGFTGWPQNCDFPSRVPLYHVDALLYHQAATLGFYLVPAPPHPTTRCDDRAATWQFRFPAAECALLTHYAAHSTPARVLAVLRSLLCDLRRTTNGGQVISDYMLKTLLWFRLEEDNGSLIGILQDWDHDKLSFHVLVILDQLINGLRTQRHRSYWFPWFNVMLSAPGGGTMHYTEEDYSHDAELLVSLLHRLHEHSHQPLLPSLHTLEPWQLLDSRLIGKWQDVLIALAPPSATRSRRLGFVSGHNSAAASQYSTRQLEYVRLILRGMLTVRALTLYQGQLFPSLFNNNNNNTISDTVESSEDLIYLLSSILDQAKILHSSKKSDFKAKRSVKSYSRVPKRDSGKHLDSYETAVSKLTDEVRKSTSSDLSVDSVLVKELLKWLYHGMDTDRRHLSPILRPFLNRLFTVSHESCWHIEEWKRRQENQELFALGRFSKLVVEDGLSPRDGIADAIRKGWLWAERVIDSAANHSEGVELVFTPSPGRVLRYRVRLHQQSSSFSTRSLGRNISFSKSDRKLNFSTLPRHTNGIKELLKSKQDSTDTFDSVHCQLRSSNPIANAVDSQRRYGTHRGIGSIVEALITLNKFSVLQEVSNLLPEDERAQVLDDIQRVSKVRRRGKGRGRRGGGQPTQRYTPLQPPTTCSSENSEWLAELPSTSKSLLGTCREARQRQGHTLIYNSTFFEPSSPPNPLGQPLLRLTPDNRLTLETSHVHHNKIKRAHNKEMVTKL
ncbi:uncharacterized protein LOC129003101 isoform X2 [Macrosteles quadrilineatus]|nr:uncharacterized protein LOC129003101 isoform X2 [Macrosteles quadrilineatus]